MNIKYAILISNEDEIFKNISKYLISKDYIKVSNLFLSTKFNYVEVILEANTIKNKFNVESIYVLRITDFDKL